MEVIQYDLRSQKDSDIVRQVRHLEAVAWPDLQNSLDFPLNSQTYVTSFLMMENHRVLSHVGIRKSLCQHRGEVYLAYGLSEVVTDPSYQRQGLASFLLQQARCFIQKQHADFCIMTCQKEKVPFYTRCGYQVMQGACLVGGTKDQPFRSDSLNLTTMMFLISSKSKQHRLDFENTDIVLELGEAALW